MPPVISKSCISAISTGTANFHWKRSAMYAEITSSEAMIAMIALFATVSPKVGPTDVLEKLCVPPKRLVESRLQRLHLGRAQLLGRDLHDVGAELRVVDALDLRVADAVWPRAASGPGPRSPAARAPW